MIALYLAAIVLANLTVAAFGPGVSIVNAFLLIGFDLTARDALHERWHNRGLWWKMLLLVASGSLLSYGLNRNAGPIALASFVAFAAAGLVDLIVYQILRRRVGMFGRMNGSNVFSAAVDSIVFPTLAFGGFLPLITLGQWLAKVGGGVLWAWVLTRKAATMESETEEPEIVTLFTSGGQRWQGTAAEAEKLLKLFPGMWVFAQPGDWQAKG